MNSKTIVQGYGAAIMILLLPVWPLLSSRHPLIYHSILPMQSLFWGFLIDLGALSGLAALLFAYLQKSETGARNALWVLVGAELAPALATDVWAVWQKNLPHLYLELLFYGTLLVGLVLLLLGPAAYRHFVRGMRLLLLLTGCGMAWMVPELLYLALRPQPQDASMPVVRAAGPVVRGSTPGDRKRIIWILFDELSYDQAFDHRYPGLAMPAFDKLKSESFSFSDLQPAGYHTEKILPSFFLGNIVDDLRSDLNGEPIIKLKGKKNWQAFDAHATLFSDAQRLGWTTGVVGWYNPYCRMLAGTLDYCFWRMGNGTWNGTASDQSVLKNAMAPFAEVASRYRRHPAFPQEEKHASDLAAILPQAEALIHDQDIGFVFIHLPVPHPPGIYDRRPGHQRATGTYIDNLALSDRVLGELMGTIHETGLAGKTTVVITSDHSWRIPLWWPTVQSSKEEETASQGRFDTRPVLMIHFPGQSEEHDVSRPFDDIRLHDILEQMLQGQGTGLGESLLAGGAAWAMSAKP
jgi:Sulfatase